MANLRKTAAIPRIEDLAMYPTGNLLIPAPHGQLEAILKEPAGPRRGVALICHPHPLGGGTMHNKVVFRAAAGLLDSGLTTLRFNFRGVGASTGVHNELDGGREDVRAALDYLFSQYPDEDLTMAGFSFGSRVGSEIGMNEDRVKRLINIGAPVDKYNDFDFLNALRKPILFVHGDRDEFGAVENVRRLAGRLAENTDCELVVIPDSGHFFDDHLNELRKTIRNWMLKRLSKDN
jgi:uncharacterized protein